ncbi:FAD-binding oxidoreductase [Leucobacter sp. OH1287]|uniref:NAD(P)/FAD-dependent oxidoreductase n=1 Tax=Leucobacter sp. OH1287 TaxID=2491049 RepID=UPI000F5F0F33|nr:FAD-dependent oxidoreductase [Leucobacter sp. OH1287]RRD59976.1 FAD-dependent oxidoreductase [Leucobacter sp. OH1287]
MALKIFPAKANPKAQTVFEAHPPTAAIVDDSLRGSKLECFWLSDARDQAPKFKPLRGNVYADYAVVGGGYAGLWTAIKLKTENPKARVVLLEAKRIGWAASGRNGGFCEASITHGEPNAEARWPDELAELHRLGVENLDAIERFITENNIDCDFERTGAIEVANEPYQLDYLGEGDGGSDAAGDASGSDEARGAGGSTASTTRVLDEAATRARINSPTFLGSAYTPDENAILHPAKLAYGLAKHAAKIGVEIYEETRVLSLSATGKEHAPFELQLPHSQVTADRVALCTNVFPSLLKRYRLHTIPVYDYALMTEPLTPEQLKLIGWEGREGLSDLANQFHYSRLTADNRILWGGYDAVYFSGGKIRAEYENRDETYRKLASHFFTTFPQLAGIRFTHRWAGVIDSSTRFCAFFGSAHGGRVQYVAGFTGLGVGATHFAADVIADRFAGRETDRTALKMVNEIPLPFPPEPLATAGVNLFRWSFDQADHRGGNRNLFLKTMDAIGMGFDS